MSRRFMAFLAVLVALLVVAPIASAGDHKDKGSRGWYHGNTTLDVDPGTLEALGSLGVTPGAVDPATLEGARYSFPITNRLRDALRTGVVSHVGGISLTAGDVTVELTDFDINVPERTLYGKVNGAGPVALLPRLQPPEDPLRRPQGQGRSGGHDAHPGRRGLAERGVRDRRTER